jgi:hypothetical protein
MSVGEDEIYAFISEKIDTVPHLEALLQLWNTRPRVWTESEIAARLFIDVDLAHLIMADLTRLKLVTLHDAPAGSYSYADSREHDCLVAAVESAYRKDLIRVSTAIHFKAMSGAHEFARAFYFSPKGKKKS